jgi:hypothetical protein
LFRAPDTSFSRRCDAWPMPDTLAGIFFILVIAAFAVAIGIGFGIVVAPRIGRLLDRADRDEDEEPGDRAD